MTLNQIFDNVQFGEEYTKNKTIKEEIEKCYDKELDIYYASARARKLSGKIVMTEAEEMKTNRIISKLCTIEDKLEIGKLMSEAYRKMQSVAILEDCKELQNEITKTRKVDANKIDIFGKIIGTAKFFVENYLDADSILKESTNLLLNKTIKNEVSKLNEII